MRRHCTRSQVGRGWNLILRTLSTNDGVCEAIARPAGEGYVHSGISQVAPQQRLAEALPGAPRGGGDSAAPGRPVPAAALGAEARPPPPSGGAAAQRGGGPAPRGGLMKSGRRRARGAAVPAARCSRAVPQGRGPRGSGGPARTGAGSPRAPGGGPAGSVAVTDRHCACMYAYARMCTNFCISGPCKANCRTSGWGHAVPAECGGL